MSNRHQNQQTPTDWGIELGKLDSREWIRNYILQYPMGFAYVSMPYLPASSNEFFNWLYCERYKIHPTIYSNGSHSVVFCWGSDVIMGAMTFQITGVSIVCATVCLGADQIKHQSPASLAFVRGIHRWPVNSPHDGPVTRKMFPFDDVIMYW